MRSFLAILLLCSPAFGLPPHPLAPTGTAYFLPAAANTDGAYGAHFRTRVYIRSDGSNAPLLVVAATPAGFLSTTLSVVNTYTSENFLEDVFHYSGGAALSISRIGGLGPFALRAEVYSDGPSGVTTTPIPTLSLADVVASAAAPVTDTLSISLGVFADSQNRLNVGCANLDSSPVVVNARLYTFGGLLPWSFNFALQPGEWYQTSVSTAAIEAGSSVYFLSSGSPSAVVFCYAVLRSKGAAWPSSCSE